MINGEIDERTPVMGRAEAIIPVCRNGQGLVQLQAYRHAARLACHVLLACNTIIQGYIWGAGFWRGEGGEGGNLSYVVG